jgi:homoserine dehydrogenase
VKESIGIGLMGLGVVGGGVVKVLQDKKEAIAEQAGCPLILKKALVRDLSKPRSVQVANDILVSDAREILSNPNIDIVVEVIGGEVPAYEYIKQAVKQRKYVVTANKEVMAKHGTELLALAEENGVDIFYEASVGGGIPLISPLNHDLIASRVSTIYAIINGTTNYILSRMSAEGISFSLALQRAQELGYAEADPANDIEGIDAAYKLAILTTLAFHSTVQPEDVYHEGITRLTERDFRYAKELGYAIKLLAIAKDVDNSLEVRVHPVFIPEDILLAKIEGVYNAVQLEGDLVGKVLFYGEGAGASPTSSAVVADIINAAHEINSGVVTGHKARFFQIKKIKPMTEIETRYYFRMSIVDSPGVLAQIAKVLGDNSISIVSVIQKGTDIDTQTAEIVIMTHPAQEKAIQRALVEMEKQPVIRQISNFVRVEE